MKRKPKVEAPAWWCSKCHSTDVCGGGLGGCVGPHCENCGGVDCLVRLADPRRDAVVKAAVAEREAYLRYICDDSDADDLRRLGKAQEKTAARVDAYTAAVEKMRRGGK